LEPDKVFAADPYTGAVRDLPMLDETGYSPEWKYAPGEEIRCHAVRIAEQFGLYGGIVETCGSAFHATWVFTHAGRVEDRRRDDRARNARQGAWGDQHLAALASTRQDSSRASRPSATN
jgi:hypothetical protein